MSPRPTLTLLVPGWSPPLARTGRVDIGAEGVIATLAWLSGLDAEIFPAGALSAHGAGLAPGDWMRLDPVHLAADPDGLRLLPGEVLAIEEDEATALATFVAVQAQLEITLLDPQHWLTRRLPGHTLLTASHDAAGRHIGPLLPEGEARMRYRQWLNELQMILHDAPVNRRRVDAGQLSINSVWPWGQGELPAVVRWPYEFSVAQDPLVAGLARLAGGTANAALASLDDLPGGVDCFVWTDQESLRAAGGWESMQRALRTGRWAVVKVLDAQGGAFLFKRPAWWRVLK